MTPDPYFDLTGKIALITGGSRGVAGLQMVRAFAERGADVIIASRKIEACEAAAEEVRALGRRSMAVAVHAGRWADMDRLVEAVYAEFGRIDILVNNAGMSPREPSHLVAEVSVRQRDESQLQGPVPPCRAGRQTHGRRRRRRDHQRILGCGPATDAGGDHLCRRPRRR